MTFDLAFDLQGTKLNVKGRGIGYRPEITSAGAPNGLKR